MAAAAAAQDMEVAAVERRVAAVLQRKERAVAELAQRLDGTQRSNEQRQAALDRLRQGRFAA